MTRFITSLIFVLLFFTISIADTIHVPDDQASIQAGIDAAVNGDTVLVADGSYQENINFKGKAITVASHFLVDDDTSHISNTIIDGSSQNSSVVKLISDEDTTTVLNGFTITGGAGSFFSTWQSYNGGGIFITNGGKILNNHIVNNKVQNNNQEIDGGGIFALIENTNDVLIFKNNIIENNVAIGKTFVYGGGLAVFGEGYAYISNNKFINNKVIATNPIDIVSGGGGLNLGGQNIVVINNLFVGNEAPFGGAIECWPEKFNFRLINNTIVNNKATIKGGGLYLNNGYCRAINNIIWNNTAPSDSGLFYRGNLNISYSITQKPFPGDGNLQTDPLFENDIFYLSNSSPAIDAGNPDISFNDLEDVNNPGNPQWPAQGSLTNDMGAFGGNDTVTVDIEDYFTEQNFLYEQFGNMHYRFAYPLEYDHNYKYPLTVVLHGSDHWGSDNEKQLWNGLHWRINAVHYGYNEFTVLPQAPSNGWENHLTKLHDLIQGLIDAYPIDTTRIVISGWSNGGGGTWRMLNKYPKLFAAAIPISGTDGGFGNIKHIPVWVYHGSADANVSVKISRGYISKFEDTGLTAFYTQNSDESQIIDAINNNIRVFYSEISGATHFINAYSYDNKNLFRWLKKQSRPLIRPGNVDINPVNDDSILFKASFSNPHNFNFDHNLRVEDLDKSLTDSLMIFDDGLHGDELSGDGIWGNYVRLTPEIEFYRMGIEITNLDKQNKFFFNDIGRYTTIDPVKLAENPYISHGYFLQAQHISLILENTGKTTTAKDVTAYLATSDPRIQKVRYNNIGFGNLDPGFVDTSNSSYAFEFAEGYHPDSTINNPIPFTVTIYSDGYPYWTDTFEWEEDTTTVDVIDDLNQLPEKFSLAQNYPNPFNPKTTIEYRIPNLEHVDLSINNLLGQKVATLVNKKQTAGRYQVEWDASGFASGIYIYTLETSSGFKKSRKLVLLK